MKRAVLISGIAVVAVAGTALWAAGDGKGFGRGHGPRAMDFTAMDTNSDGKLTREEMQAHGKARFDAADSDGSGAISSAEMVAHMMERAAERMAGASARMIERHDANGDGELSLEEMGPRDGGERMFSRLDNDGDGAISAEEFAEMRGKHKGRKGHGEGRMAPDND